LQITEEAVDQKKTSHLNKESDEYAAKNDQSIETKKTQEK